MKMIKVQSKMMIMKKVRKTKKKKVNLLKKNQQEIKTMMNKIL